MELVAKMRDFAKRESTMPTMPTLRRAWTQWSSEIGNGVYLEVPAEGCGIGVRTSLPLASPERSHLPSAETARL